MAVDNIARMLAAKALSSAGGAVGREVDYLAIKDDNLWVFYNDGDSADLGRVVGLKGAVFTPHVKVSEDDPKVKILSWTLDEEPGEIPDPVEIRDGETGEDGKSIWEYLDDYLEFDELDNDLIWEDDISGSDPVLSDTIWEDLGSEPGPSAESMEAYWNYINGTELEDDGDLIWKPIR